MPGELATCPGLLRNCIDKEILVRTRYLLTLFWTLALAAFGFVMGNVWTHNNSYGETAAAIVLLNVFVGFACLWRLTSEKWD